MPLQISRNGRANILILLRFCLYDMSVTVDGVCAEVINVSILQGTSLFLTLTYTFKTRVT